MASTIILKNGTGSAVPSALAHGEPAINVTTGLFYYGSGSGGNAKVKTLSNFTNVTASGQISASGNIIAPTFVGNIDAVDGDFDGTLEADSITIQGQGLEEFVAGIAVTNATNATNATNVATTENTATVEDNYLAFLDGATSNQGVEVSRYLRYNPGDKSLQVLGTSGTDGHITASGDISASGDIIATGRLNTGTDLRVKGNAVIAASGSSYIFGSSNLETIITGSSIVLGDHAGSHVTASGNISASGDISASNILLPAGARIKFATDQFIKGENNNINIDGDNFVNITADTAIRVRDGNNDVFVSIDPNVGHISASGNISSSGNITAANVRLPGAGKISFDDTLDGTDQFIKGTDNNIQIEGDDFVKVIIDKEFYVGTSNVLANFKVDTAGNITSSGNIVVTGSISSSRLLTTSASFGTSTVAPSSSVTIEGRLSSSGDIETEGFIYSENHEILVNSSFRGASIAVGDYAYPSTQGFMNTNWSEETGGGPPDYSNAKVGGIVIPYSCSLVGVRANINANQGGANHTGSFTIWAERMQQGMATTAHEPDLIFEMYMPQPAANKNYQYSQLTGVTASQAANYSVLTPGHALNVAYKNEAGTSHNAMGHYCILIKRIKELH